MTTLGVQIVSDNADKLRNHIMYVRSLNIFDEVVAVGDLDSGMDIINSAKLADKFTVMNIPFLESAINVADNLSTTKWRFRLDDDEFIGENFVKGIRKVIDSGDGDVIAFPRMWLYPNENEFISCYHWYPDFQVRCWKHGHIQLSSAMHQTPKYKGNILNVLFNIFHYKLINSSFDERKEYCIKSAELSGMQYNDYISLHGRFYLPELVKLPIFTNICYEKIKT